ASRQRRGCLWLPRGPDRRGSARELHEVFEDLYPESACSLSRPPLPFLTAPSKSRRRPPSLPSAYSAGGRWVPCGGTNRGDIGLNLSGSWQQGHSATYNTPSRI